MKTNIITSVALLVLFGVSLVLFRTKDDSASPTAEPDAAERQDWLDAGRMRLSGMRPADLLPDLNQD